MLSLAKSILDYGHTLYITILCKHSFIQWSLQTVLEPSEQENRTEKLTTKELNQGDPMLKHSSLVSVLKWSEKKEVTKRLNYLLVHFTYTKGFISLCYQLTYFFEHDVTTQYNTTEQSQLDVC